MEAPGAPWPRDSSSRHVQTRRKVAILAVASSACALAALLGLFLLQATPHSASATLGSATSLSHGSSAASGDMSGLVAQGTSLQPGSVNTGAATLRAARGMKGSRQLLSMVTEEAVFASTGGLPWSSDAACVSSFPSLCKFVDALPIPATLDGASGEVLDIGIYNVWARLHRDVPKTKWYGYGLTEESAATPGPTILAKRNISTRVRWANYLTDESYIHSVYAPPSVIPEKGGIPVVMHLHGGETEPASDGHPLAWFTSRGEVGSTFVSSLYTYHNTQDPATLWCHDHTMGLTQLSTYFGLSGFYIISDPEKEAGFSLPSGAYDVPINILNKVVNADGTLHVIEDEDAEEQVSLEVTTANNVAWPYLDVDRTKYRFRLLNSDSLRRLNLTFLSVGATTPQGGQGLNFTLPPGRTVPAYQIATDAGYIERPVELSSISIAPAERVEVVFDFDIVNADVAPSNGPFEVYLVNYGQLELNEYGLPVDTNLGVIMKFRVSGKRVASTPLPAVMNDLPRLVPDEANVTRYLALIETPLLKDRVHVLGGKRWPETATEITTIGTSERWFLINETPQIHTIHLHLTKFRVISRQAFDIGMYQNGSCSLTDTAKPSCYTGEYRGPHGSELGWKDTVAAQVGDVTQIMFNLNSMNGEPYPFDPSAFPGYVWHCHIAEHEDFEMMRPFLVVPPSAPGEEPELSLATEDTE